MDAKIAFEKLAAALASCKLPTDAVNTSYRSATADEFMLMHGGVEGWHFKHRETRNYLLIRYDGKVVIPRGGPFCGGFYGPAPEPAPFGPQTETEALRTLIAVLPVTILVECLESLQYAPDVPETRLCRALLLDAYGDRTSPENAERYQDALRESREIRASLPAHG